MKTHITIYQILFLVIAMTGCSDSVEDYKATVRDGIKTVPHVEEIKHLFPSEPTDHFITQYGFDKKAPVLWNTEVFFGGRYTFTYQTYVLVDYNSSRIVKIVGPAKFDLVEVARVTIPSPDSAQTWDAADYHFGEKEWDKIIASNGDFTVIGIKLKTNSPIPNFQHFVNVTRRDRVRVENKTSN